MGNEQKNIIVSGFGGQGVLFLGTVICRAAILENKNTTWIPSYGAEMRGGSANCYVVVSKDEIASPIFDDADYGIFLSKQAFEKFNPRVKKEGLIVADSTTGYENEKYLNQKDIFKPLKQLIHENNPKMLLNIVALGVFIKNTKVLSKNNVLKALEEISSKKKPEFAKLNLESFEYGYSL